jgi:aspartate aminotransferase
VKLLGPDTKPETVAGNQDWNVRVASMKPSATLAMTSRANDRKRAGHPVIGLSAGEPDFDTPVEIADAAVTAIREGFTHYTNNAGIPELRKAICDKLKEDNDIQYEPGQVLCSNGAKQSVAQAITVLCQTGDEVVIPAPYWVSYPEMTRFAGATPVAIATDASSGYRITPDQLEAALSPRTRAFILCSPSNPTGGVYSPDELRALAEVLARWPRVIVISDEIYEYIIYDQQHLSMASIPEMLDRTVTVNGFSKAYAMTGWRLGYMAGPSEIVKACSKLQSQLTSAPSSISQKAGVQALKMSKEPIQEMVRAFRERRDFVLNRLSQIPNINCPVPDGAFYVFPDVSAYFGSIAGDGSIIESSEDLCFHLLDQYDVALVPGAAFGGPSGIRISYAASMDNLSEAMSRLTTAFSALKLT